MNETIRDVIYACRGFRRAPLAAATVVGTVGLGLGLVAVAFTLLNLFLFRVDSVPNVHEMFAVDRIDTASPESRLLTRAQYDALRRDTSVFQDVYAQVSDHESRVDGRRVSGSFLTGNAFQVLGVQAARGRTLTPADDDLSTGRPVVVLSDRGWERLFARDPAVVGRSLLVNGVTFDVVGVMPDGFRALHAGSAGDYWAPLAMLGEVRPADRGHEAAVRVEVIGRLKPGLSQPTALAGLAVWDNAQSNRRPGEPGAAALRLKPRQGTVPEPLEAVIVTAPFFVSFGLILLIGCANVANLLLARGVARQREIGVRLSLGATRRRVVRQLLTESLVLSLAAAAVGYAISRVALEVIIHAVLTSWPQEIGDIRLRVPAADWRVLLFLVAGAVVSTVTFALAPALQASRIEPLRTIRGEIVRDARPGRARNFLIGLQVSASALLLISAAVFLRSAASGATFDPGLRIADTFMVSIASEPARGAIVRTVAAEPGVEAVAAWWPAAGGSRNAVAEAGGVKATISYSLVSHDYFGVLDIPVVGGRAFTPAERTPDLAVAMVSESAARALWPGAGAVGQSLRLDPESSSGQPDSQPSFEQRTFTVVGVVRDVPGFRVAPLPTAVVYLPANTDMPGTTLVGRVRGDVDATRRALLDRLTTIDASADLETLRWITRMETYLLKLGFWFTVVLGALALALTVSGLFSVLSYLVEQRTREIGVRMALGATVRDVTRLVLAQSVRPVGIGLLMGGGSAAALATLLLASPLAGSIGQLVRVLDPVAYAVSLSVIVLACLAAASIPAARAARLDPATTLRQD